MEKPKTKPLIHMPIKAEPYNHQIEAFNMACRLFGLAREKPQDSVVKFGEAYNSATAHERHTSKRP